MSPHSDICYTIDPSAVIVTIEGEWDAFATANGAPALTREAILGRSLWDFIHDMETRYVHRELIDRAQRTGQSLSVPFRCDAPDRRRCLRMDITPRADGGIEYRSREERVEARAPIALLDPASAHDPALLRMCSWCKRIHVEYDFWLEVEDAVAELDVFGADITPGVTHTICEDCRHLLLAEG